MVGIISNSAALFAQRNLAEASASSEASIARLSSGKAIIKASDDVSGLAIGTVIATTVSTLKTVLTSTSQASSLLSIADAGLSNVSEILQRQKSLATQANTGTLSDNERAFLNQEFTSLTAEIDRIVDNTEFNGIKLLNGSIASSSGLDTALPAAASNITVDGTVGTTGLSVGIAFSAGTVTELNDDVIGALTADNTSVSGAVVVSSATVGTAILTVDINGVTFRSSTAVLADGAGATTAQAITFVEEGAGDLAFTVTLQAGVAFSTVGGATTNLDALTSAIEADVTSLTIYQARGFAITAADGVPATAFGGTVLNGMDGGDFVITSSTFDTGATNTAPVIGSFSVVHEDGSNDASVSVSIDGNAYSTIAGALDADIGNNVATLYLDGDNTNTETFIITFSDATPAAIALSTAAEATAIANALNSAFGSGDAGGLEFQTGTKVEDSITVSLNSASSSVIYRNDSDVSVDLSVDTAANAIIASDVLDNAINTVTSLRATLGALQSRFDFAAANVTSSIQNQEAARSDFLDVDIAAESTAFATAQVRLQASISVLAQANQIPQNLLKLIG